MAYVPLSQEFNAVYKIIGGPREGGYRQNLVPNPSFETGVAGWGEYDGPNTTSLFFTPTTSWFKSGKQSLRYRGRRINTGGAGFHIGPVMLQVPAAPGPYSARVELNVVAVAGTSRGVFLEFFGPGYLGAAFSALWTSLGERTVTLSGTAPTGTTTMRLIVVDFNTPVSGEFEVDVDSAMIVPSSTIPTEYADGDTPGWAWSGTAHNSTSYQNGTRAVLNDPNDVDYVGAITELTGLDSPEVRESADDLVEADGGMHGSFYFGRRPITMNVRVFGHATALERAQRLDRLRKATMALRQDAQLIWSPISNPSEVLTVPVRRQQPTRETGGWNKDVQLALVSELAVIRSGQVHSTDATASGTGVVLENKGNWPAYPQIAITGAATNPQVTASSGGVLKTGPTGNTLSLAAGETILIDTLNHTASFIAGARNGQSANKYIDFANTTIWPYLAEAGNTTFTLSGGGTMIVYWRDTWA